MTQLISKLKYLFYMHIFKYVTLMLKTSDYNKKISPL